MKHTTTPATTSRAARAASIAGRLAVFTIAAAAAVFAALALTGDDADAQQSGRVKVLEVGGDHACALTEAGGLLCWGRNDLGQATADFSPTSEQLLLGEDYSCTDINTCWGSERHWKVVTLGGSARQAQPNHIGIDYAYASTEYFSIPRSFFGSNIYG